MTRFRTSKLAGLLAGTLLALACGNVASTGNVHPGNDGGGASSGNGGANGNGAASGNGGANGNGAASGNGGANGNGAASGDGGTSSPGGASGASGASGESGAAGAAGTTGGTSSGGTTGSGGSGATDAGLPCRVPQVPPNPNPTPEQMQRATLIHDYCVTLTRDHCLDSPDFLFGSSFIFHQALGCSIEGRMAACELDRLYEYPQTVPACDDEWQAIVRCLTAQTFAPPCQGASLSALEPVEACRAEQGAWLECGRDNRTGKTINGAKAMCHYDPAGGFSAGGFSGCYISCTFGVYGIGSECGGPAGLPIRCSCWTNGFSLGDLDWGQTSPFYASNCSEAAQRIADGEWCTNRLDCCLQWTEGSEKRCQCGSETGCAQAAETYGATRVETCPQYHQQ